MNKIIYKNIILFLLLVVLPWYISVNEYRWNILDFDSNYLLIPVIVGSVFLVLLNVWLSRRTEGNAKTASLIFIIPPALVLLFFIAGYFAFTGFTGF
ncbi:hypothetical protein KKF64_03010 [Patescibacteria group bacterium]|nr:hypothetical protein [Patescibacteria group bacterium]